MNHILDEMQEKMYEFEQNKKNNLIFHGILADHPETPDGYIPNIHGHAYFIFQFRLTLKVANLIKANVSIKREMPISKASRVYSGKD